MELQLVRSQPIASPSRSFAADDVFARSRFFLRQKHFSLQEKYFVWDERGQKLMFVERPRHHARSFLAIGGAIVACLLGVLVGIVLTSAIASALSLPENIKAVLTYAGSSLERVFKCTVFLANIRDYDEMNRVYITFFPKDLPARSTVAGSGLAIGAKVEIECLALAGT